MIYDVYVRVEYGRLRRYFQKKATVSVNEEMRVDGSPLRHFSFRLCQNMNRGPKVKNLLVASIFLSLYVARPHHFESRPLVSLWQNYFFESELLISLLSIPSRSSISPIYI